MLLRELEKPEKGSSSSPLLRRWKAETGRAPSPGEVLAAGRRALPSLLRCQAPLKPLSLRLMPHQHLGMRPGLDLTLLSCPTRGAPLAHTQVGTHGRQAPAFSPYWGLFNRTIVQARHLVIQRWLLGKPVRIRLICKSCNCPKLAVICAFCFKRILAELTLGSK